jgi:hypothetical protein
MSPFGELVPIFREGMGRTIWFYFPFFSTILMKINPNKIPATFATQSITLNDLAGTHNYTTSLMVASNSVATINLRSGLLSNSASPGSDQAPA